MQRTLRFLAAFVLANFMVGVAVLFADPLVTRVDCSGRLPNPGPADRLPMRIRVQATSDGSLSTLRIFSESRPLKQLSGLAMSMGYRNDLIWGSWSDGTAIEIRPDPFGEIWRGRLKYEGATVYRLRCQFN